MKLITEPNFRRAGVEPLWPYSTGDAFYEALIGAHRDLCDDDSALLNSKLVLLLANHIGDLDVLDAALAAARKGIGGALVPPGEGAAPGAA